MRTWINDACCSGWVWWWSPGVQRGCIPWDGPNAKRKSWMDFTRQTTTFSRCWMFLIKCGQMSNSSSEHAITSFHLVSCFMHLSLTVSHSFISVISSSRQHICVSSISPSKERKSEGDRPVSYDDDKYACRLHQIVFVEDVCFVQTKEMERSSKKKKR